jgi:hypothetical protein
MLFDSRDANRLVGLILLLPLCAVGERVGRLMCELGLRAFRSEVETLADLDSSVLR